jgi:transcriptional regulator with XRE-family HTH domain
MAIADNVSRNILATREAKDLTQATLAKKAKISVSYVSMLERGARVPPLETLEIIAKALGVPPLDLLQRPAGKAGRARKK